MNAMILAAGRGERMRPLTDQLPKPLIQVRGKPLIVHHIEKLVAIGVERIVINVSYRAEQIVDFLGNGSRFGCDLRYSHENTPLESGGGVATASAFFDQPQFILVSADVYSDIDYSIFSSLAPIKSSVNQNSSFAYFFLVPTTPAAPGREFALDENQCLNEGEPRHTLANICMISTELVRNWPRNVAFKLMPHYRDWVHRGIVKGEIHRGEWCNVTTVDDVRALNAN